MYLTQIYLNPRKRQVRNEIANRYELHRTVMSLFPEKLSASERVLFRLEEDTYEKMECYRLLLQSETQPDLTPLIQKQLNLLEPQVKEFDPVLARGTKYVFKLRVNPVFKKTRPGKLSQKMAIMENEKQIAWLQKRLGDGGASLLGANISQKEWLSGSLHRNDDLDGPQAHELKIYTVLFEGTLRIEYPDKMAGCLKNGIGSAKAFGCGLLSLARMQ